MCYNVQQKASLKELTERFTAKFELPRLYKARNEVVGFTHPVLPILTSEDPNKFVTGQWGLIPHWSKDIDIRKHTLNAKQETLNEKPSFRDVQNNRCILPVTGFYEWKWLDRKGKRKEKYLIKIKNAPVFGLAGLFSDWKNPENETTMRTFTLLTTTANDIMAEIHNTKKRMPLMLNVNGCKQFLKDGITHLDEDLKTDVVESDGQLGLF